MGLWPTTPLERVRRLCLALPEATERLSHGAPTFFVRGKKTFVMFLDDHHGDGRLALWCSAPPGVQAAVVEEDPVRFFVPPYVGHRGWIGVRLDIDVDWDEIAGVVEDAYRDRRPQAPRRPSWTGLDRETTTPVHRDSVRARWTSPGSWSTSRTRARKAAA